MNRGFVAKESITATATIESSLMHARFRWTLGDARSKRPDIKAGILTIRLEAKSTVKPGGLQHSRLSSLNVKRLNECVRILKAEI